MSDGRKITLDGDVAHIHYTFRNTGADATDHPATEQEVPAVFVDYAPEEPGILSRGQSVD